MDRQSIEQSHQIAASQLALRNHPTRNTASLYSASVFEDKIYRDDEPLFRTCGQVERPAPTENSIRDAEAEFTCLIDDLKDGNSKGITDGGRIGVTTAAKRRARCLLGGDRRQILRSGGDLRIPMMQPADQRDGDDFTTIVWIDI